jgi:hypothetical protein
MKTFEDKEKSAYYVNAEGRLCINKNHKYEGEFNLTDCWKEYFIPENNFIPFPYRKNFRKSKNDNNDT